MLLKVLLWMPDGYRMPPHFHGNAEHVEVKQGALRIGVGDKFEAGKMMALAMGDTATAPARARHYSVAVGETIVSVTMMGPYVMTYASPHDEPWGTFPYGY